MRCVTVPDPVHDSHTCEAWISPDKITLRRHVSGIDMYLAVDLHLYQGVVAREVQSENTYSLHLIGPNTGLNLEIGRFDALNALAASWEDWGRFTQLPLLVETETGTLRPLRPAARPDRRQGRASALKYRRRRYAAFRAKGDLSRSQTSFKGAREIICYE